MSQLALDHCAPSGEIPAGGPRKLLLIGNPNVGKSLLFGCLTNRYVNVSNYPGTTVEITTAKATISGEPRLVIDTPGTNGLIPQSDDERVARDMLISAGEADIVQVGDMSNIRRTLLLSLQIAEHGCAFTLCLNMSDEARERDSEVDTNALSATLGIPVVATSALRRWNLERLKRDAVKPGIAKVSVTYPDAIERGIERILESSVLGPRSSGKSGREGATEDRGSRTEAFSRGIALSILAGDETLVRFLPADRLDEFDAIRHDVQTAVAQPLGVAIAQARLHAVDRLLGTAITQQRESRNNLRDRIGALSMHPVWGVPFLAFVLYIAWLFVGKLGAGTFVDFVETHIFEERINVWSKAAVQWMHLPHFAADMLVGQYGVITMAITYAIAIVLPVVITFFFFFGVLEDSGYLPRLAIMLNRIFRIMGLNGKAVLPMVLGLGCDTMATLTTRILETKKEATIVTLLLALGVPCSAQLGVIMAMLGPLPPAAAAIWIGVTTGTIFLVGWAASKVVPGQSGDFILEIPPIRVPKLSNIAIKVVARTEWYLKEAVPLFIIGTVLLYVLDAAHLLTRLQKVMAPLVVHGLGLPAESSNAFLIGFLRRDYGAAGFYAMQKAGSLTHVQTVIALTVITLFVPCIANFLVMLKERGTKMGVAIAAFIVVYAFGIGAIMHAVFSAFGVAL